MDSILGGELSLLGRTGASSIFTSESLAVVLCDLELPVSDDDCTVSLQGYFKRVSATLSFCISPCEDWYDDSPTMLD